MLEELAATTRTVPGYRKIESCHSTWIFDEAGMRFRRVLRSDGSGLPACVRASASIVS